MVVNHPRVVFLVQVIEVNQLDQIFDQLQQQYFEDVEHRIKILNSLLEPLLIHCSRAHCRFYFGGYVFAFVSVGGWIYLMHIWRELQTRTSWGLPPYEI